MQNKNKLELCDEQNVNPTVKIKGQIETKKPVDEWTNDFIDWITSRHEHWLGVTQNNRNDHT